MWGISNTLKFLSFLLLFLEFSECYECSGMCLNLLNAVFSDFPFPDLFQNVLNVLHVRLLFVSVLFPLPCKLLRDPKIMWKDLAVWRTIRRFENYLMPRNTCGAPGAGTNLAANMFRTESLIS